MKRQFLAVTAACLIAGCDGNPINLDDPDIDAPSDPGEPGGGDDGDGGIDGDGFPPGTDSPDSDDSVTRFEDEDGQGGGFAQSFSYDAATDTFSVDNIAFDADNVYDRGELVSSLGPYAVYESDEVFVDSETGEPIDQIASRAIYGVSDSGRTEFAIVRSGGYVNYGFGGFVYERNGAVELPVSGQAAYEGDYAGIRVFQNAGGLEYTVADVSVNIDFDDFNEGSGVRGRVFNRQAFDIDGTPLPTGTSEGDIPLPDLVFTVGPGVLAENGELRGDLQSTLVNESGALEVLEAGQYYGVIAGEDAGEVVGVIVVESEDPRRDGVSVQETGGFIVTR